MNRTEKLRHGEAFELCVSMNTAMLSAIDLLTGHADTEADMKNLCPLMKCLGTECAACHARLELLEALP
jgi:hypothetical protein